MESDVALARDLTVEIGDALLAARDDLFARYDNDGIKDAADLLAQDIVARRIAAARPDDALLSEEGLDSPARLDADRVWIVDPLDGTREYARAGRIDWAVHVALWEAAAGHGGALTASAVALPAQGVVLDSERDPGVDPGSPARDPKHPIRIVASASRTPLVLERIAAVMPIEIVLWGSAGAKAARVVTGEVDAYVHDTDLSEWDSAAPVGVALAHGFHASHLDGSPLIFNKPLPRSGDLLICRADLAQLLLHALAGNG